MGLRAWLIDLSRGDDLEWFWTLYRLRERTGFAPLRSAATFLMSRSAHRHGGYVGPGAVFQGRPMLPHGLHGVFISRFAVIGEGCRIYQNVTIGEVGHRAPVIGPGCQIGAGAVLVGDIRIGRQVKIGAGAVVSTDIPDGCTVVAQRPRVLEGGEQRDAQGYRPSLAGDRPDGRGP